MLKPTYLTLLKEFKTEDHYHSNRCLFDHLLGTYHLLKQWDNPETTCVAGLFHSIYGIKTRHSKPHRFAQRKLVQSVIGISAERLVYLFCTLERGHYLSKADECKALIEIEVANIVEQAPFIEHFWKDTDKLIMQLKQVPHLMSPKASQAYQKLCTYS